MVIAEETDELISNQSSVLGISSFIKEAESYKNDDFSIDLNELFNICNKRKYKQCFNRQKNIKHII